MQGKVGVEPSGDAFNAISLEPITGRPRNPMINAGAIATAAQVWHHDPVGAETTTLGFFSALAGRPLQVEEEVYRSERQTGHRNRAISHLLRNVSVIESEPEGSLDLYFRQCSIGINCRDLAVMAATLACQGRNPLTNERPLDSPTTARMLAVMGSCGMYDYAGQWLYDVGIPAKSGVGGGVLAAVPGRLGIGVYSPRLDRFGNSVRGIAACRRLSENLQLHLFDRNPLGQSAVRSIYRGTERRSRCWRSPADGAWLQPRRARIAILHRPGSARLRRHGAAAGQVGGKHHRFQRDGARSGPSDRTAAFLRGTAATSGTATAGRRSAAAALPRRPSGAAGRSPRDLRRPKPRHRCGRCRWNRCPRNIGRRLRNCSDSGATAPERW
jgi:glutaminase